MKSLEDALVAEWCPTEDGEGVVSIMGLLLQRLEACAPAEGCCSACPLQVGTPAISYSLAHEKECWTWSLAHGRCTEEQLTAPLSSLDKSRTRLLDVTVTSATLSAPRCPMT